MACAWGMVLAAHALRACRQQRGCQNNAESYCRWSHPMHAAILAERREIAILNCGRNCALEP